jgi:hypothetical protein
MFAPHVLCCQSVPSQVIVSPWSFIGCGNRQATGGHGVIVQVEHMTPQSTENVTGLPVFVVTDTQLSLHCEPTHQSELFPLAAVSWNVTVPAHVSGASGRDASPG